MKLLLDMNLSPLLIDFLARISHKDRRERPISSLATGKRRLRGAVLKTLGGRVCRECFWGCNAVDMVLTGFAADSCEKCGLAGNVERLLT